MLFRPAMGLLGRRSRDRIIGDLSLVEASNVAVVARCSKVLDGILSKTAADLIRNCRNLCSSSKCGTEPMLRGVRGMELLPVGYHAKRCFPLQLQIGPKTASYSTTKGMFNPHHNFSDPTYSGFNRRCVVLVGSVCPSPRGRSVRKLLLS